MSTDGMLAWKQLERDKKVPLRVVLVTSMVYVFYGFRDALGKGFGSLFETTDGIASLLLWPMVL
jgi:hypothetical protein